jgi:hypothetical protein
MSINPNNITTVRIGQLASASFSLSDNLAHEVGTELKKGSIQEFVDFLIPVIGGTTGSSYFPLTVVSGDQLPNVPTESVFFFAGKGTFLNINGYPDIVTTKELNVISSTADHWVLSTEIPITVDLPSIGISQSISNGVTTFAPSENAVYQALLLKADLSAIPATDWIKSNESLSSAKRLGDLLYGILDQYTGEEITLSKVSEEPVVDDVIFFQLGDEYFKRNDIGDIKASWYGCATDKTASENKIAITKAVDFVLDNREGKVVLPPGTILTEPIHIKQFDPSVIGGYIPIEITSESIPNQIFGTIGTTTLGNFGTILKCETEDIYESVIICDSCPTSFENFSGVKPIVSNIQISTYQNSQIGGIDARFASQLIVENVQIDNGVYSVDAVLPTYPSAIGIHTPRNNNAGLIILRNVSISGYHRGLIVNEHTSGHEVNLTCNLIALDFQFAYHSSILGQVNSERNQTNVKFSGAHSVNIENLNLEHAAESQTTPENEWQLTAYDVDDATNIGRGLVNWYSVLGAFGNTPLDFRKNGGEKIKYINLHENKIEIGSGIFGGHFRHNKNPSDADSRAWRILNDYPVAGSHVIQIASDFDENSFIDVITSDKDGVYGLKRFVAINTDNATLAIASISTRTYNGSSVVEVGALASTNNFGGYAKLLANQTLLYGQGSGGLRIGTGLSRIVLVNGNADIDNADERLAINVDGSVEIANLAGTGDRGVSVDSTGKLIAGANVTSGSYTPTLTAVSNCSGLTLQSANYTRIGNIINVMIYATGTTTSANTATAISANLPINRAGVVANQKMGRFSIASENNTPVAGGYVVADTTTATMMTYTLSDAGSNRQFIANFQYDITQ